MNKNTTNSKQSLEYVQFTDFFKNRENKRMHIIYNIKQAKDKVSIVFLEYLQRLLLDKLL